ncbi:MAG TPA: SDR family oxidoreductase, partial [bacterium]|nr:SDR family oxidoreductase [bacterium]
VIHNAACVRDHTVQNLSDEDWDKVLTVNLKAPYYLTKKILPLLFKRRMSKIFMLISRMAVSGGFGASNYAAAKAGLIGLTKSLAAELARKNILVNAVNPGFMLSAMTEALPEEVRKRNQDASYLGRFSDPEEVAGFLVYLCSDAMTQVTGQILHFESRNL